MSLWSKRMSSRPDARMMAFTASLSFDRRLCFDDLDGTAAHVRGLAHVGLLSEEEEASLLAALETARGEFEAGTFAYREEDEDVHTAIERRVTELAGEVGEKLHTARSRNDQVATALRLYARRELGLVAAGVLDLAEALVGRARSAGGLVIPGYTHLQRAQRIRLSDQLLAHGWAMLRDVERIVETRRRLGVSPLGAGAVGGSSLPLDPAFVAAELGFSRAFDNPVDAVSDRDFVAETLFDLALLGVHLSRLGEEVVIYSSSEFGYYVLDDAFATGSSLLPQKKNPDVAELARGKSGRLIGHLAGFLATLKGLPLAYNRDLQEDKEPLFDALDQVALALPALRGLVESVRFNEEVIRQAAADPGLRAVELVEWLVGQGVAFRQAHGLVATLVRQAEVEARPLRDLVTAEALLGAKAAELLGPDAPLAGRPAVSDDLGRFGERVDELRARAGVEPVA